MQSWEQIAQRAVDRGQGVWVPSAGVLVCVQAHTHPPHTHTHTRTHTPAVLGLSQPHIQGSDSLWGWECYCFKTNE